jgi:cellulose synthase/poly-beta-1,6-N-acetylglucosamine synthase-like glycosyltransferase
MQYLEPLFREWYRLTSTQQHTDTVLFWVFLCILLIQLIYYWLIFFRLSLYKVKNLTYTSERQPVSVIIAARDEYRNLYENLPAILEQQYPKFEVIVVNNESTDDSATLLKNFQLQYPHLRVITLEKNYNFFKGKKFPLSIGIRSAKYDLLLFTDADCIPSSPHWINHMQSSFQEDTGIVLGIGQYTRQPGLLNMLIRYETFFIAQQYLSFTLARLPYMGIGRNLAYRKSLFMKQKGFISHYNLPGGDDDLFVNQASGKTEIGIQVHPEAQTYSRAPVSFRKYLIQKRRHLSTAKYYRPVHKWMLGLFTATQLLFWVFFIIFAGFRTFLILSLFALILRWITQIIVNKTSGKNIGIKILSLFSPMLELMLLFVYSLVFSANLFSKPKRWK